MDSATIYSLVGGTPVAAVMLMLWREIRSVRVELGVILKDQGRRLARVEDKVFPTGPSHVEG